MPASGVDAYTELTNKLEDELEALPAEAVETVTHNGLTIRELVAHLTAIDNVVLNELQSPSGRQYLFAPEVETITYDALARVGDAPFADVFNEWRATRRTLRDAVAATAADRDVMGYKAGDALVIRAFETWTHLDDIRRTDQRSGYVPEAPVLRSMADLSMRGLPYSLAATGRSRPGESIKVVLTGPGGRTWNVPCAPGERPTDEPSAVMTVDIVDWCRRFADRIEPDALETQVEGDRDLAADLVAAAPSFAGL
jgi:uncharacterized protein (TIGR03083 family)